MFKLVWGHPWTVGMACNAAWLSLSILHLSIGTAGSDFEVTNEHGIENKEVNNK
jgi:hypothetical protein